MSNNDSWPFINNNQVHGLGLPVYLDWAAGKDEYPKKLMLPPIQRGFVWKPKQIVDLWDSLLRGMPIGSMMVNRLKEVGCDLIPKETRETKEINNEAIGLLDGQQRTLAMLIGFSGSDQHCLWIDFVEKGHKGSPFKIRLTTRAQPFGFDHVSHDRLSRNERKRARENYNVSYREHETKPDYELFELSESEQPRPWKADGKIDSFVRIKDLWQAFKESGNNESAFPDAVKSISKLTQDLSGWKDQLSNLYNAFIRMKSLQVPLILIPEYISASKPEASPDDVADPLILLFERIGRSGSSLSADDLLFSMIKRQWPEAQNLVNNIHDKTEVKAFMNATDYVMTAFRLAAAQYSDETENSQKIADIPRPKPGDFHRHLGNLLSEEIDTDKPLRNYLKKDNNLVSAFDKLYNALKYEGSKNIGLPVFMMPHLSRGLIQVLLRWIMRNSSDEKVIEDNRQAIVSFTLFWYLNIWHEDRASKKAFEIIGNDCCQGTFPASVLYNELSSSNSEDEIGLALPLMSYERLDEILNSADSTLQSYDEIFRKNSNDQYIAKRAERELYKRFCWWRKPVLLWLQRGYVKKRFESESKLHEKFAGFTDEDAVPYDFDHLCPQKHWGDDWWNIRRNTDESSPIIKNFKARRHDIGNCIGNLHVLESSLNRSYGDVPLGLKLKKGTESEVELEKWGHEDSLLYHFDEQGQSDEHKRLWEKASPYTEDESDEKNQTWDEVRVQAFQKAVYRRAKELYRQYHEACKHIIS